MGTRLSAVASLAPTGADPLADAARQLSHITAGSPSQSVVVHLAISRAGPYDLLWCQPDDDPAQSAEPDAIALLLSTTLGTALSVYHNDTLGEAGYAIFRSATEVARNDAPIPGAAPLYTRVAEGFERAFPGCGIGSAEDAFDLFYGPESTVASFVVCRDGTPLANPEPYVPPPSRHHRPDLLYREFSWGRRPRQLLRGCSWLFAALGVGMVLFAACWLALELWRAR